MKILIMIPSYGKTNSRHLQQIMDEFDTITEHELHFIIYTTENYIFKNNNIMFKHYPHNIGIALTHQYKQDLLSNINNYDLFIYLEDDIFITNKTLNTFISENSKLPNDYVIGFLRYEIKHNVKFLNELSKNPDSHSTIPIITTINNKKYFKIQNVHQGSFIFERRNLKLLINNNNYLVQMGNTLEDAASNFYFGIWPGTQSGIKKVYPVDAIDNLLVYHLSEKHTNFHENLNLMTLDELKSQL